MSILIVHCSGVLRVAIIGADAAPSTHPGGLQPSHHLRVITPPVHVARIDFPEDMYARGSDSNVLQATDLYII